MIKEVLRRPSEPPGIIGKVGISTLLLFHEVGHRDLPKNCTYGQLPTWAELLAYCETFLNGRHPKNGTRSTEPHRARAYPWDLFCLFCVLAC